MPAKPLSDELAAQAVELWLRFGGAGTLGSQVAAAKHLGIAPQTFHSRLKKAAERGLVQGLPPGTPLPGFAITAVSETVDAAGELRSRSVQQRPEAGEPFEPLPTHRISAVSTLTDGEDRTLLRWVKTKVDTEAQEAAFRAVVVGFCEALPRGAPEPAPQSLLNSDLLNQFTITDLHFGMLSWREETGADWDLKIAEETLLRWFAAAIAQSPPAATAVLAQLGDLLHHDSHSSVTPEHGHVLDADSRLPKIIRTVIRVLRQIVQWLLQRYELLHVIMADANHDPAGGAWLREMFAAFYENEPRILVNNSASSYYAIEHGAVSLFYHHGHRRKINSVDSVFAGKFRESYGRTRFSYAHIGHQHSDELRSTNLMQVERHETLAAPDAYAANGGWLTGRSAKVITYSKLHGEVGRLTLTPAAVSGGTPER